LSVWITLIRGVLPIGYFARGIKSGRKLLDREVVSGEDGFELRPGTENGLLAKS